MKSIAEMLKPRESVFSDSIREDVLNLSDFNEGRVNGESFFSENYETQGMKMLFETAFKRFKGESDTGVIKLTQAMGGGKTHSMLALALLAQDAKLREKILGKKYKDIGDIKVITFSGREDAEFGIWGALAEQLGKKELFSGYYSPLKAPGESAWINLLQEDKILILFDELPPYLENARSITVGNSDLSKVTITALANLFSALGKAQLANVCLVFSDLRATYESGSELLQSSFKELEAEANRIAIEVAPVQLNSDEVYHILRKRLFEDDFVSTQYAVDKNEIAIQYKEAVAKAKKLGFTNYSGEAVFSGITDSYPFHPSIKDLYARFKENQNFQQTRGLIKLMRQIVRRFWESGMADRESLINVYDVDLNTPNLMSLFRQIKPSLEEAISHDIAQDGQSIAEIIDAERGDGLDYAQRLSKLLLVSSLSNVTHQTLGLTDAEALGFITAPGIEPNAMKTALEELKTQCWYIKTDNRGRLYFQNTKNMVAEMNTLIDSYTNENAKKELKKILETNFKPNIGSCYEQLYVFPAVDEIELDSKKVSLVIFEPYAGRKFHPDLQTFYDNCTYKNRVMFLSGERDLMEKLYENSKKLAAIQAIKKSMTDEGLPASDQQFKEAETQLDKATQALFSTIRETFVVLYYPTKNGIESADFKLEFKGNRFDGEEQIVNLLKDVMKYEEFSKDDMFLETMRKKCEQRLFTTKEMTWQQISDRAATQTVWGWYYPSQMDSLKADCLKKDKWRESSGYIIKGPFEKEPTSVSVEQIAYNEETEEFTLKVRGIGGRVYYDVGSEPTSASNEIADSTFTTKEPEVYFACIDNTGERKQGPVCDFICEAPLKYGKRTSPDGIVITLETNSNYEIRYTTDGSDPKENGGLYNGEFVVPQLCKYVLALSLYKDRKIDSVQISIDQDAKAAAKKEIDVDRPLSYVFKKKKQLSDTEDSYKELDTLEKIDGVFIKNASAYIYEKANEKNYVEYNANILYVAGDLKALIDLVRDSFNGQEVVITFEYKELVFTTGAKFNQWVDICKLDLDKLEKEGDIKQ